MNPAWMQAALAIVLSLTAPFYLQGCGGGTKPETPAHHEAGHDHDHDHEHGHEGHDHHAPHGGTLIAVGEHFSHLEVALDSATGKLTAYSLDGEAEKAVPLSMPTIPMTIKVTEGPAKESFAINLEAVANTLTGETIGNTSEFTYTGEKLKGATKFEGTILSLEIKGQSVKDTAFKFPEGNECPRANQSHTGG